MFKVLSSKANASMLKGSLYYLFLFLCVGAYNPFLYVYIADQGISGKQIGILSSLVPVSMLLFATTIASFADMKGWRVRILRISLICWGLAIFFLQFPHTFWQYFLVLLPLAIVNSPTMSIADSLIARMARRESLNFGGMRLWGSAGYAISAFLFGAIWQRLGFDHMFLVGSILIIPLIWIVGKFDEGVIKSNNERKPIWVLFKDKGLMLLLAAIFLSGISNGLSMTYEGIYVRSLGGGNFLIGIMIACAATFELPAMFFSQRIAKRFRWPNTILLGYTFTAMAYLGYLFVPDPNLLPFFSVLKGIGYGLNFTSSIVILTERTPDEWASASQSLMAICWMGLAPLVAGPLGGIIHDAISPGAVFGIGLVALVGAAIILWGADRMGQLD